MGHELWCYKLNESEHRYECVREDCGYKYSESHVGGAATCTQRAMCDKCNSTYGTLKDHTYDQCKATAQYLASEATCQNAARYYYSCKCGAAGVSTFASGTTTDHKYSTETVAPSCSAQGYDLDTCIYCSYSYKKNYIKMDLY